MRIVFLGNHDVGCVALDALRAEAGVRVVGVVAHPPDPEDGVVYRSVHDHATKIGLPVIRGRGRDEATGAFLTERAPDLLWITDYRYLLPMEAVAAAPLGAVNLHPSLLPRYRGRAPINWAILHGERTLGLTAHIVDAGTDTGPILGQRRYTLAEHEDVGDALRKLMPLYASLTRQVVRGLLNGSASARPQAHHLATQFPRRRPRDGRIDWTQPGRRVRDLVRAVARPYPGAFSDGPDGRVFVWKAALPGPEAGPTGAAPDTVPPADTTPPGTVLSAAPLHVQCGDGPLVLLDTTGPAPQVGQVLGAPVLEAV